MKIDLKKSEKEFIRYTEKFDLQEPKIELKQKHSIRVMQISKQIAETLNLTKEEVELATLIGLLHDFARFEQYTKYRTFRDTESIDHGNYGVKLLFEDNLIRNFVETNEYDEIIKKAIRNHNKYKIEDGLSEKELLYAKLIRDADKIDIMYEVETMFWKDDAEIVESSKVNQEVYEQFIKNEQIKREAGKKYLYADKLITTLAFIFDINYKKSFEIIKEKDYINKILDRFNFKNEDTIEKFKKIRKNANDYINNSITNCKL